MDSQFEENKPRFQYDASGRIEIVEPAIVRTNMTYDTGQRLEPEPPDQPFTVPARD